MAIEETDMTVETTLLRLHTLQHPLERQIIVELNKMEGKVPGIPLKTRTEKRQEEIDLQRMQDEGGIKVFGENDLLNTGIILSDIEETHGLIDIHILDLDQIYELRAPRRVGERVIVCQYQLGASPKMEMPDLLKEMLKWSFRCRIWKDLRCRNGTELQSIELTDFRFNQKPQVLARRYNDLWVIEATDESLCA